jgi:antagonist of KipI
LDTPSPFRERGTAGEVIPVRTLPGPQADWFPDGAFFARTFALSPASNRMGVRLLGEPIPKRAGELASEPVAPGAVQVTNDGLPIVLGVDGQTVGGYPKVAHVIRADLDRLGRLRPGDHVRFVAVSVNEAEAAAQARARALRLWRLRLEAQRR